MLSINCPLCSNPLSQTKNVWSCEARHSFDSAREGYVNLLPVQQKKSREPGDSVEMVQGRRDFLAAGYYQNLRDAIVQTLKTLNANNLVDIGCGEGYYTQAMADIIDDVIGFDIAKSAVKLAAKRDKNTRFLVANSAKLLFADQSADVLSSIFSPLPVEEMARVLKPSGHLLFVRPGMNHLRSLREVLFDDLKAHQSEKFLVELAPRFECISQQDLNFPLNLPQTALHQLLMMTPYAWRAKPEKRALLEARETMQTNAEFSVFLMQKKSC